MIIDDDSYLYIDKLKQYLSFFIRGEKARPTPQGKFSVELAVQWVGILHKELPHFPHPSKNIEAERQNMKEKVVRAN